MPSWQLGSPGTALYRLYDALRAGLNRALVSWLGERAAIGPGAAVLEAGSGPAMASSLFARRVRLAVALDRDAGALRQARARDPRLPVVQADLAHLPFRPGSFDLSWSSSTLEHLDDDGPALDEMRRVTRAGGAVFVGVPSVTGPLAVQKLAPRSRAGIWIGTVFSARGLSARLASHGLTEIARRDYFFRFFVGVLARRGA
jgi:ubiquinone/menaquinone biosynthesis C-methylase UbiE